MARKVKKGNNELKKVFKKHSSLQWLVSILIPISENCNAVYNKADVLSVLFEAALTKVSVAGTACAKLQDELVKNSQKRIPSPEYFRLFLKSTSECDFQQMFIRLVQKHINILKSAQDVCLK